MQVVEVGRGASIVYHCRKRSVNCAAEKLKKVAQERKKTVPCSEKRSNVLSFD